MNTDQSKLLAEVPDDLADHLIENAMAEAFTVMRGSPEIVDLSIKIAQCASTLVTLAGTPLIVKELSSWIKAKINKGNAADSQNSIEIKGRNGQIALSMNEPDALTYEDLEPMLKKLLVNKE